MCWTRRNARTFLGHRFNDKATIYVRTRERRASIRTAFRCTDCNQSALEYALRLYASFTTFVRIRFQRPTSQIASKSWTLNCHINDLRLTDGIVTATLRLTDIRCEPLFLCKFHSHHRFSVRSGRPDQTLVLGCTTFKLRTTSSRRSICDNCMQFVHVCWAFRFGIWTRRTFDRVAFDFVHWTTTGRIGDQRFAGLQIAWML